MNYTYREFKHDFPDDNACLNFLFNLRYSDMPCHKCGKQYGFTQIKGRKSYACNNCGSHISPTAGTIFHKSATPLTDWFHAIFLMSASRNGVAAMELQRHIGVTYKTAWRMARHIRILMGQSDGNLLSGVVEIDETYVGGKQRGVIGSPGIIKGSNKTTVFGMVERGGKVKAQITKDASAHQLLPVIRDNVAKSSNVVSDEWRTYNALKPMGYSHKKINHQKAYAIGDIHTNTIEGFWSQMKRSINGTYHVVSPKYLQHYVDEFAFRYSNRNSDQPLFALMLARVVQHA